MRVLEFRVRGQEIAQAAGCDFSGIVRGSMGYLKARFIFDKEWDGCRKAASFFDANGKEHAVPVMDGECEIPAQALTGSSFSVSVTGMRSGFRIKTARLTIMQGR